jgi:hypothetical protein
MDAAGKEYFLEKQRTKVQSALPPHLHAWCAAILAASSLKEISDEDRCVLVQHATDTTKPEMLLDHVFVARSAPAYQFQVEFLGRSVFASRFVSAPSGTAGYRR